MGKEKAMTTPRKPRLLPCPFCGKAPREDIAFLGETAKAGGWIGCSATGEHHAYLARYTRAAAVKAWNTRRKP